MTYITSFNPATLEEIGKVPAVSPEDIPALEAKARRAFETWSKMSFRERAGYIMKARRYILDNMDDIALVITKDNGKPLTESLTSEIIPTCDLMSYFAKTTKKLLRPQKIGIGIWNLFLRKSEIHFFPFGVIGVISPWNYPFSIPMGQITMALMAGNCVMHKASSGTPLVGKKIEEVFKAAGLPDGVFTDVSGGSAVGTALIEARMDKIIFTGSVPIGKKIMEMASKTLTPVVLELGGKDPMIVCHDANIETASSAAVWGAFTNSGQVCASVERLYVHESIAEEFTRKVVEKTKMLRQGPGDSHNIDVGSMTTESQLVEVEAQIKDAKARGAKILTGGERNRNFKGWFYKPTVLTNVDHSFKAVKEETFGPTLPIMTFKSEEEAVRLANDSTYSLTASVWTKDMSRGKQLAKKIKAGTVMVNDCTFSHGICQTPWGGEGDSGFGRSHSYLGLMELVRPQHIHTNPVTFLKDLWWYPYGEQAYALFKKLAKTMTTGDLAGFFPSLGTLLRLARLKKN